jgi:hypothetical protein
MKVKVTPPYEGAGSFEIESSMMPDGSCFGVEGAHFPASWCEPIPEVVPEPGDICEFWCEHTGRYIARFVEKDGDLYVSDKHESWQFCRVLARKPKGYEDRAAKKGIEDFLREWGDARTDAREQAAYERFLSAILGVPYARVGE